MAGELALEAQKLEDLSTDTADRFVQAEAAIKVNADNIKLKATHEEVNSAIAGALDSITSLRLALPHFRR